jgi:hypothetical protein
MVGCLFFINARKIYDGVKCQGHNGVSNMWLAALARMLARAEANGVRSVITWIQHVTTEQVQSNKVVSRACT